MTNNRCTVPFGKHPSFANDINLMNNTVANCCKTPRVPLHPVTGALTPQLVELRKAIINNERSPQCKSCWETEDAGGFSLRNRISKHLDPSIDWSRLDPFQPIDSIGVMFSNKCQMMCSYCGPMVSSMWEKELSSSKLSYPIQPANNADLNKIIDINKIKFIKFTGGEPLLEEKCVEYIMSMPVDVQREICISTNLSYGPAIFAKLLSIISMHVNVGVATSLDSLGENPTRKYFNWDLWSSNFAQLAKIKLAYLHVTITASSLNHHDIPGVIEYLLKFKRNGATIGFDISHLNAGHPLAMKYDTIPKSSMITIAAKDYQYLTKRDIHMITSHNTAIKNINN